ANPVNLILNFTRLDTPSFIQTALPVWVNEDGNGALTGSFSANVSIGNDTRTINLPNTFNIKPEWKQNLNVKLTRCGAYTSSGVFQEFMCYNLGADTSADPFVPSAAIHGAKYQWGYKPSNPLVSDSRYLTQKYDQANRGAVTGWDSNPLPIDSWSDTSKTANDPCPDGYRVPTQAQWQAVLDNNNIEMVGTWGGIYPTYGTAVYFRTPLNVRTLMLPATAQRYYTDGRNGTPGGNSFYWASSMATTTRAAILAVSPQTNRVLKTTPTYGVSVRCVKE
ncbi:hypothetical protein CMU93_06480, partial [Elizabethkingia anophelis]|nr:hypothetical protein [Elizabethkingia anophelis]